MDEKLHENILISDVANKTLHGAKPLCISFKEVGGYITKRYKNKYLGFFHPDKNFEIIFGRIRYLVLFRSNISDVYSCKYTKIKIILILIKSVFNRNHNHYYHQIFFWKIFK